MGLSLKSPQAIKLMALGGQKLAVIRDQLVAMAQSGTKLAEIETQAQNLIKQAGGRPSFSMVPDYHWATCINLNQGVVHGVPNDTVIKPGDLVSIDIGLFYRGFHTDTSVSFIAAAPKDPQMLKFLSTGKQALKIAISQAKPGNRIGHISQAIQQTVESVGYSSIRKLTGHGIGKILHEPPAVPCFVKQPIKDTPLIKPGLTLAIEVIYAFGSPDIITDPKDHWTVATADNQPAAVFEHTVAVTNSGPQILTQLKTSQTDKKLL